jgi:uncharacterized protein (TIGR02118 family)
MICVSVFYPSGPGKKFDHGYYAKTHMPLVLDRCKSYGLIRYEIDNGLASEEPDSPAPFAGIGRLYFDKLEGFQAAMQTHGPELLGDVPNYTDIEPQFQISEVTAS